MCLSKCFLGVKNFWNCFEVYYSGNVVLISFNLRIYLALTMIHCYRNVWKNIDRICKSTLIFIYFSWLPSFRKKVPLSLAALADPCRPPLAVPSRSTWASTSLSWRPRTSTVRWPSSGCRWPSGSTSSGAPSTTASTSPSSWLSRAAQHARWEGAAGSPTTAGQQQICAWFKLCWLESILIPLRKTGTDSDSDSSSILPSGYNSDSGENQSGINSKSDSDWKLDMILYRNVGQPCILLL